jgi:hypothetical protein
VRAARGLFSGRLRRPRAIDRNNSQQPSQGLLATFGKLSAVRALSLGPTALYFLPGAVQFFAPKSVLDGSINRLHGVLLKPLEASPSLNSTSLVARRLRIAIGIFSQPLSKQRAELKPPVVQSRIAYWGECSPLLADSIWGRQNRAVSAIRVNPANSSQPLAIVDSLNDSTG